MSPLRRAAAVAAALLPLLAGPGAGAQTDLDALMRDVVARRDDNWKKLQQYVLDEHERIEIRGPSHVPVWGERRDYTWYLRDGFFVRSPVRVNGVDVPEAERLQYERDYLRRVQERDTRGASGRPGVQAEAPAAPSTAAPPPSDSSAPSGATTQSDTAPPPGDVDSFIRQSRQPGFISSAYFLRFKFEEGRYALVGREQLDGRDVLRVEYYPERLFSGTDRRRNSRGASDQDKRHDAAFQRLMNKVALVTLWIEPASHQIVKYTFDNVALDFLPAQWLVQVDDVHASMTMGQPIPGIWLPGSLDFGVGLTLAAGQFDAHYTVEYSEYRRADVGTKLTIEGR